jgi:hypothetical protein
MYLNDERPRSPSWETMLLCSIAKADPLDKNLETINRLFDLTIETNDEEAPFRVTPMKKRKKLDIRSPALDAGFELILIDLDEDLGESTDVVIANILRQEWKKAGRNFLTLKELVEGARDAIETLVLGTKEEFGKADVELCLEDGQLLLFGRANRSNGDNDSIRYAWDAGRRFRKACAPGKIHPRAFG